MAKNKFNSFIAFYTLTKREFLRFFRVPNNTIFPQLITVLFYLIIFGIAIGSKIKEVAGFPYLLFILPGLFTQMLINGSYSNPSGSLYMARAWGNMIDILMSPIGHKQFVFGYVLAGMARGFFLGVGTLIIGVFFLKFTIFNFWILITYSLLLTFLFACCGVIIGLMTNTHEQLNIFINFVVTPLTFLGGVFYTLDMVPTVVATITKFNPIFYLIDGVRYGMLGHSEGNIWLGLVILAVTSLILYLVTYNLIKRGYNLKV